MKHRDRRSELALIKPTFHVSSVFILILNQLRQIFQTTHSHFCQCRIQWASLIELSSLTDQSGISYNHKRLRSPEHDIKYTALNSFLCLSLLSFVQDKSCLYTFYRTWFDPAKRAEQTGSKSKTRISDSPTQHRR